MGSDPARKEKMNAEEALKVYFGYDSFKEGQKEVIDAILDGRDALAVMPTGAGKSVCYQVPAMILPGITIVISPLISLMQDQVKALNEAGIHAGYINSSLTEAQIGKVYSMAELGAYKILYVAPERLENVDFTDFAERIDISMVTVDEAHCISQWGQDFRPSYLKIVDFIDRLQERPVVSAFTATATEEVKTDIACVLKLRQPKMVVTGFDRENLWFDVQMTRKKDEFVQEYIRKHPDESGIVYCATRKNVDALYERLSDAGVPVARYHAGMGNGDRKESQDDFIYDRTPVIVATNAFGMGIDKSNVRFVIHYNMPQSMENYYQEAGRAGRDGGPAQCILLFSPQDIMINKMLLEHKELADLSYEDVELIRQRDARRLQIMEGYCRTSECFRNYILSYFGERRELPCESCGNCQREFTETDMTEDAKQVINCVYETRGRYGLNIVLGTLLGASRARLRELHTTEYRTYGALKDRSEADLRLLVSQMIMDGYLVQTTEKYSVVRMGNISPLKDPATRVLIRTHKEKEPERERRKADKRKKNTDVLTKAGYSLFDELKKLRLVIAREQALPPYIIFSDKTLIDMSAKAPLDKAGMLRVSGVGEAKYGKYGARFMEAVARFLEENPGAVTSIVEEEEPAEEKAEDRKSGRKKADSGADSAGNSPDENKMSAEETGLDEKSQDEKKKLAKKSRQKAPFSLRPEDAEKYQYKDLCLISEIKDELNRITSAENVKHLFGTDIFRVLTQMGYVCEQQIEGRTVQMQTEQGLSAGIATEEKISKNGNAYTVLLYPVSVQKEIVEHYIVGSDPVSEI